jgi:CheY-like chemotaxis protein
MVVDDVPENRQVLARLLTLVGCEVATAATGEELLQLIEKQTPDIIFLDVLMPGMDGIETARRVRERRGATIRLVATSASAFTHEQEGYRTAGFEDVVSKPIPGDRLYECLGTLLGVKFNYVADVDTDCSDLAPLSEESLPTPLRQRLAAAAELYSVTELRQCIDETERLGPQSHRLGMVLRRCVHDYDMAGILRLVRSDGEQSSMETVSADGEKL